MEIINRKVKDLIPYDKNPRKNDEAVKYVKASIEQFGFKVPIVIDADGVIVAGHTRVKAAKELGMKEVPCIVADDLNEEQIRAFRLADNKTGETAEWNVELLNTELLDLEANFDMADFGFEIEPPSGENLLNDEKLKLSDKYIVPPFSVLNTQSGEWQERKKVWKSIINSEQGRGDDLLSMGHLSKKYGLSTGGSSIFDPVLAEILVNWFCPKAGKIIDPFAGGSVRGLVSSYLGAEYTGIDIRQEQIDANEEDYERNIGLDDIDGKPIQKPKWIAADGLDCQEVAQGEYDFFITCPPYADLEVYSDNERDISNMEYPDFKKVYREIIRRATDMLKQDSFAAIVVGEVRDKKGNYRGFVPDTIQAFEDAGCSFYNEIILVTSAVTLPIRVASMFVPSRKIGKRHQNVLIFCKGDGKKATAKLQPYEYTFEEGEDGDI